jgi:hypothetical protein
MGRIIVPEKLVKSYIDFAYCEPNGDEALTVRFCYDRESGKPETISFFTTESEADEQGYAQAVYVEDNRHGQWRPCVTHVEELIRRVTYKPPPKNAHAKQRARKSKPVLAIFDGE